MNTEMINNRLYTLCRTFDEMGLEPVMANYDPSEDNFVCEIFFADGITPKMVYDKLKLPKLFARTNDTVMSTDNSWTIMSVSEEGVNHCMLTMSRELHVSVIVWILKKYGVK